MRALGCMLLLATVVTGQEITYEDDSGREIVGQHWTRSQEQAVFQRHKQFIRDRARIGRPDAYASRPIGSTAPWVPDPSGEWRAAYREIHGAEWTPGAKPQRQDVRAEAAELRQQIAALQRRLAVLQGELTH